MQFLMDSIRSLFSSSQSNARPSSVRPRLKYLKRHLQSIREDLHSDQDRPADYVQVQLRRARRFEQEIQFLERQHQQ